MKFSFHNSLRALFLSLAVLLSLPMLAEEIDGIKYVLNAYTKQATVIAKSSGEYSGEVVIPESVEHEGAAYSVTSIGPSAFSDCSGLTSVTIPNSVTSIRRAAFEGCSGLTSVTIGNGVESIGEGAFSSCSGLTSVIIPNSVTSIGNSAFQYCSGLTSVYIPKSVTSIGESAFEECTSLLSVIISNSVTSIGESAFEECIRLILVTIPNSVTSIGDRVFSSCYSLTSVTIPNSVTSIGNSAFQYCSGLTSVTIGNSVESIGDKAFYDCYGLTSVTIPNSVTSIGGGAFSYCYGLTSVTIGNGVESIGQLAFANCSKLHDVYCYAEEVPSTGSNAFSSSPIANATLYVPYASIDSYKVTAPWSSFGTITSDLTLADGEEFENNTEECFATLTYTRTLPNMLWNPLYVPFKIPYEVLEENYEVAYINAMHSYDNDDNGEIDEMVMEIVKIKAGTLKPNHPYLIKAKNDEAMEMSIVQENATLYPAEITTLVCSSVYTKFEITGTYQEMTSEDLNGSLVISTDGAWTLLSSTSILKPFRFYLTISNLEGSPVEIAEEAMSSVRIRVMGESDNATGIDETENTENSVVFDLYGRRVSTPAKGGVYIINGKKVIY